MIDPFTALSLAAGAVSNAKKLIAAGRDASSALSKFAGCVADVNYASEKAKNPGLIATLTGSAEQQAMDAFTAHKKMQALRKEIETLILFQHGMQGVEEYKETLRKVRAQRRKTLYKQAELKAAIINWTLGILFTMVAVSIFVGVVWLIGKKNGNW